MATTLSRQSETNQRGKTPRRPCAAQVSLSKRPRRPRLFNLVFFFARLLRRPTVSIETPNDRVGNYHVLSQIADFFCLRLFHRWCWTFGFFLYWTRPISFRLAATPSRQKRVGKEKDRRRPCAAKVSGTAVKKSDAMAPT